MVETLKTNTDLLETSNTAKEWTEKSPSSKLKDIQNLLNNPKNEKEQELSNLIEKREYKKFQKEIGAPQLDGKLGQQSYECFKAYENKEQKINNIVFKSEKKQKALNKEIFNSISIYNTGNQEILSSGNGKIEIKNRDINFGIQLTKIEGSIRINKNIESIKHFFLNRNNGILEIYEEQSKLPRFKLYPDGLIKGRSERNSNKYDIILQNDSGLLRATMLELNRDYDKYKNPIQKDIYNIGEKIKLNNKHIRFDGLSLYNAKTKQGEKIDCIKNFYINRTNDNRFEIFESGGTTPKLIINKEGVAKGSIPGNPNELNYGYTKDTTYYKLLRNELDNRYNKLNHKDPKIAEQNETDDKLFTNYLHLEPENLNKPKKEIDKNTPEILYKDFEICDRRNNGKSIKLTTGTLEFNGVLLSNGGPDTEIREPVKNMAIQKEGNNIYIYGNGNKYPRFILGQDGNVKGSIFNGDNECSYKAYNDKILRQDLWKELNEQYIAQNTTNNTVSLNGNSGVESNAKKTDNNSGHDGTQEKLPENIVWKTGLSLTEENMPQLDDEAMIEQGTGDLIHIDKTLIINKVGKLGDTIYINDNIHLQRKYIKEDIYDYKPIKDEYGNIIQEEGVPTGKFKTVKKLIYTQNIPGYGPKNVETSYMGQKLRRENLYNTLDKKYFS